MGREIKYFITLNRHVCLPAIYIYQVQIKEPCKQELSFSQSITLQKSTSKKEWSFKKQIPQQVCIVSSSVRATEIFRFGKFIYFCFRSPKNGEFGGGGGGGGGGSPYHEQERCKEELFFFRFNAFIMKRLKIKSSFFTLIFIFRLFDNSS